MSAETPSANPSPRNLPLDGDRRIVVYSRSVCGAKCSPVRDFGSELRNIISEMFRTMYHYRGIGLAAPQIGIFNRLAIIHYEKDKLIMVNPVVLDSKGESMDDEGCLSIPGPMCRARVLRNNEVEISYQDVEGRLKEASYRGYMARAVQHEIDHLDGIFFIDRVSSLKRQLVLNHHQKHLKSLRRAD